MMIVGAHVDGVDVYVNFLQWTLRLATEHNCEFGTAESHVVQLVCIGETRIRVVFAKTRVVIQSTAWSLGARIQSFYDSMRNLDRQCSVHLMMLRWNVFGAHGSDPNTPLHTLKPLSCSTPVTRLRAAGPVPFPHRP